MRFPMSFFEAIPLIGLVLLGALSPLLTFAALFQQKEWRLDRLREHLRRDGWLEQLIGRTRIVLGGIWILGILGIQLGVVSGALRPGLSFIEFLALPIALAALTVAQVLLHRQRTPIWTQKAILLFITSLVINLGVLVFCALFTSIAYNKVGEQFISYPYYWIIWLVPYLQTLVALMSWMLWKPVDYILKKRVMDRAMHLRSKMEDVTVIGIAGSVGKTTVKELIAHLLQDLEPAVTPAHVNTEMGVAQWLTKQSSKAANLLIVEMGAYRKGEIALLCQIAQPTIGVMTALGSDHLALFGSEQNIIDANGELIKALPKDGHAFFYGDNAGCKELAKRASCPVTIAKAESHQHTLQGRHNDYNVSLAVSVAQHMNVKAERITELLKTFKPQAHTFTIGTEKDVLVLDDTYNISPLSMNAALDWAANQTARPRVLLTSGLQETGAAEAQYLEDLGAKASKSVERVIFTDEHGADIFAKAFGKPVEVLGTETERVEAGSVLLAVGRMPLSRINRLLPLS